MPLGRPCTGRTSYIRIKLQQSTHTQWTEIKSLLGFKSDNELASYLLSTVEVDQCTNRSSQGAERPGTTSR